MTTDTRRPAVAGTFYPREASALRDMVDGFLATVGGPPTPAIGAIAPHAGLVYSGQCAAHVLGRIALPPVIAIIAPNHTGRCSAPGGVSVWPRGAFATPLGEVPVAEALADALLARCSLAATDHVAHGDEHAIEVELPFLQAMREDVTILPIVLAWDDWRRAEQVAAALAELARHWPQPVLLLASSDMTHYEPAGRAREKDQRALEAIARLDGAGLLEVCRRDHITMCGRAPAAVVVEACRQLGATTGRVVDYRHSGDVTGDDSSVVAYAGVIVG
ncbi:MAG: AmmeMemoRadiSam system protein B [Gemmatimonadota bacterium]|nr:AmmeMemoRadiSam system protein B [Gemmatimonadota bacterium]